MPTADSKGKPNRRLALTLSAIFLMALVLGPGPGIDLVNPDVNGSREDFFVFGLPIIYVWGMVTYCLLLSCVLVAYFTIWADDVRNEQEQTDL